MKRILLYILLVALTALKCGGMIMASGYDLLQPIPANVRLLCEYAAFAALIFCPMLIGRRWRWTYALCLLIDLWIWSNLVYYRAYGDFLCRWLLPNLQSMHGVWGSTLTYSSASDLLLPLATIIWIIAAEWGLKKEALRAPRFSWAGAIVGVLLLMTPTLLISRKAEMHLYAFDFSYTDRNMNRRWYVLSYGPIMHFLNEAAAWALSREARALPVMDEELLPYMQTTAHDGLADCSDSVNILLVLFESLEYWTVDPADTASQRLTPCMSRLISEGASLYNVRHMVADGRSADAQILIFSGLMPIQNGATCMRYPSNTYPSVIRDYGARDAYMYAANRPTTWNQDVMCRVFGFDGLYAEETTDSIIMERTWEHIAVAKQPWWVVPMTMASHPPYEQCGSYEAAVSYTDRQIGRLLDSIRADASISEHTLILITGDHTRYEGGTQVPLIIYDPQHAEVEQPIDEQIDIYRWLRERLKIQSAWLGTKDRSLSDRLIRTNYFAQ